MALHRGFDGSEPVRPQPVGRLDDTQEERRNVRTGIVASATLACPSCDAPVAPGDRPLSPADAVTCPYCAHPGAVRDFLSLDVPTRPAHVVIRVVGS